MLLLACCMLCYRGIFGTSTKNKFTSLSYLCKLLFFFVFFPSRQWYCQPVAVITSCYWAPYFVCSDTTVATIAPLTIARSVVINRWVEPNKVCKWYGVPCSLSTTAELVTIFICGRPSLVFSVSHLADRYLALSLLIVS